MKQPPLILFLAPVLLPALLALALPWVPGDRLARTLARMVAFAVFVLGCALSGTLLSAEVSATSLAQLPLGFGQHAFHFVLDPLNAPLIVLLSLLSLSFVLGGPAGALSPRELEALLWIESLGMLMLLTADLLVLALSWTCLILPSYFLIRHKPQGADRTLQTRIFHLYHGLSSASFLSACCVIAYYLRPSGFLDVSLTSLDMSKVPVAVRPTLFVLLTVSALLRMGMTPFHSWLPVAFERGSLFAVTLMISMRTGIYLLARFAIPAFPDAAHGAIPILTAVALFSALYGAMAALGQSNLRRLIAFSVVSQSGIMLTGLVFGDAHSVSGTLLYWLGFGVATTGLVTMVSALESRTGQADMRVFGGLVRVVPNLSACFFMFGLATIAIPGTVAFVAEDMLVHAALEAHPLLTLVMIAAMLLNALTLMRAFKITFLGERRGTALPLEDLLPQERMTAVALVLLLVAAGIFPGPLVRAQSQAAKAIAFTEQAEH